MIRSQIQKIGDNLHKFLVKHDKVGAYRETYTVKLDNDFVLEVEEFTGATPKVYLHRGSRGGQFLLTKEESSFLYKIALLCYEDTKNFDDLWGAIWR